jgi:outer membrane receptor protein involved in Fe transport
LNSCKVCALLGLAGIPSLTEANLTQPVGGYTMADLNVALHVNDHFTFFGVLNNAFDKRYYTYGSFGPVGMCRGALPRCSRGV